MPLPNRVDPLGRLFATAERGEWMGNRGGRFHDPESRAVPRRSHASRRWICCRLSFKGRRRSVWGHGYTELFFADEVSALAAGHRPCFECRRADATAFAEAWGRAEGAAPPDAATMDARLHEERLRPDGGKRLHPMRAETLPVGAMLLMDLQPVAVSPDGLRPWSFAGYGAAIPRLAGEVEVVTPPAIVAALAAGYQPQWRRPFLA
jgi:hypothetical protein